MPLTDEQRAKGRATQKARREGISVNGNPGDPLPEVDIEDPAKQREHIQQAAWWAANHQKGDKPPSVLAKRFLELVEDNPKDFMRGVLLPILPKAEAASEESEEKRKEELQNDKCRETLDEWLDKFHEQRRAERREKRIAAGQHVAGCMCDVCMDVTEMTPEQNAEDLSHMGEEEWETL
jgi:hypothetical protein